MIFHLSVLIAITCFKLGGFSEPNTAQPLSGSLFQASAYTCKQFQGDCFLANSTPLGKQSHKANHPSFCNLSVSF